MPHRLYQPTCSCHGDQEEVFRPVCPECGTRQQFMRWGLSTTEKQATLAAKRGLPLFGSVPPDVGPLYENCGNCDGTGVVDVGGGDTWADCPECDGRGGFRLLPEEKLAFLRRRIEEQIQERKKSSPNTQAPSITPGRSGSSDIGRGQPLSIPPLYMSQGLVDVAKLRLETFIQGLREDGYDVEVADDVYQGDQWQLRCVLLADDVRLPLQYDARRNRWLTCGPFGLEHTPSDRPERDSPLSDKATTPESNDEARDSWASIDPERLCTELARGITTLQESPHGGKLHVADGDHSLRDALSAAVDDESALYGSSGEPWWDDLHPMEVLDRIPEVEAHRVVICWVSDSPASGEWSLNEVHAGGRGFVFYVPDFGIGDREDCPIIAGWEPVENENLRRECLVSTYADQFKDRGYPPFFGQWARGDTEVFCKGMKRALERHPEAWTDVYRWVRRYMGSRVSLEESDIELVAESVGQSREHVESIAADLVDGAYPQKRQPESGEAAVIIGLYVQALGKGPY